MLIVGRRLFSLLGIKEDLDILVDVDAFFEALAEDLLERGEDLEGSCSTRIGRRTLPILLSEPRAIMVLKLPGSEGGRGSPVCVHVVTLDLDVDESLSGCCILSGSDISLVSWPVVGS